MDFSLDRVKQIFEAQGFSWCCESIAQADKPRYWRFDVWRWEPRAYEFAVSEVDEKTAALEAYEKIAGGNDK